MYEVVWSFFVGSPAAKKTKKNRHGSGDQWRQISRDINGASRNFTVPLEGGFIYHVAGSLEYCHNRLLIVKTVISRSPVVSFCRDSSHSGAERGQDRRGTEIKIFWIFLGNFSKGNKYCLKSLSHMNKIYSYYNVFHGTRLRGCHIFYPLYLVLTAN